MNGLELVSAPRGWGISRPAILFTSNPNKYLRDQAAAIAVLVIEKPGLGNYPVDSVREAVAKQIAGAQLRV